MTTTTAAAAGGGDDDDASWSDGRYHCPTHCNLGPPPHEFHACCHFASHL